MSRQAITWIIIVVSILTIVCIRASIGVGVGRIYVEATQHEFAEVDVPILAPGPESVAGVTESASEVMEEGFTTEWVKSSSAEAQDFATSKQLDGSVLWTTYDQMKPKVFWTMDALDTTANVTLASQMDSSVLVREISAPLKEALENWSQAFVAAWTSAGKGTDATYGDPKVEIDWPALAAAGVSRDSMVELSLPKGTWNEGAVAILASAGMDAAAADVAAVNGGVYVTSRSGVPAARYSLSWSETLGLWIAVFFTLAIFSFLYRDNPFYKVAEATVVGVSAAYYMVVGFWDIIVPNLLGKLFPLFVQANFVPGLEATSANWFYIIPAIFSILMLMRLSPKGAWLSLWTLAFIVGTTAALRMIAYIESDFLSQVRSTIIPLWEPVAGADGETNVYSTVWASIRNFTIILGVLTCLTYFFFSVEHKGAVGKVARFGIWFLMITFGAAFGFTVMGRIALLAARFEFLFNDWLWLIDPDNQRTFTAVTGMIGL